MVKLITLLFFISISAALYQAFFFDSVHFLNWLIIAFFFIELVKACSLSKIMTEKEILGLIKRKDK